MTEGIAIALIAGISAVVVGMLNLRATRKLKHEINSRMDQFIVLVRREEHAKGLKEGREEK